MGFEATRLVRFIAADVITHHRYFDIVNKDVEHLNGIAVGIFHLFGNLAINSGSEHILCGKDCFQKLGKNCLQVIDACFR